MGFSWDLAMGRGLRIGGLRDYVHRIGHRGLHRGTFGGCLVVLPSNTAYDHAGDTSHEVAGLLLRCLAFHFLWGAGETVMRAEYARLRFLHTTRTGVHQCDWCWREEYWSSRWIDGQCEEDTDEGWDKEIQ